MKCITKLIFIDESGEKFFGEGPFRLLKLTDETGSLKKAADQMGMAYTKALKLLKRAERSLGFTLTQRQTGGSNGGGSKLTWEGREWVDTYEKYREACVDANNRLYSEFFDRKRQEE